MRPAVLPARIARAASRPHRKVPRIWMAIIRSNSAADMPAAEVDRMIAIHIRGTFLCGREAARAMRAGKTAGRIVTISSTSAYECDPGGGHYNAAKAGIVGLTRSMAIDFAAWGIRVNSVAPGWIYTDMTVTDLPKRGVKID